MPIENSCVLCQKDANRRGEDYGRFFFVDCIRCGSYQITLKAELVLASMEQVDRVRLSWVTRERSEQGAPILILAGNSQPSAETSGIGIQDILQTLVPMTIAEQMDRALSNLARRCRFFGDPLRINLNDDYPLVFAHDPRACSSVLEYLEGQNILKSKLKAIGGHYEYEFTPVGWERLEALQRLQPKSDQVFVAMWFDESTIGAWKEGIEPGINETGYKPLRVDMQEFNDKICDYIISQIRKSRFVVADVTGHRPAVYFEAGYAMGLGLPVIYTCKFGEESRCSFDTRQYNHIVWSSPAELRERLVNRIGATIIR